MPEKITRERVHTHIYFFCLLVVGIGLSFGKAFLSIGMVLLILNFLIEGKYKAKMQRIRANKLLLYFIAFYLLIILGTTWSIDFFQGLKDIKSRLPLLVFPVIIGASKPLTQRQFLLLLRILLASVFVSSLYNFLAYNHLIGSHEYAGIRGMSLFGSHIRYALLVVIGIAVAIHLQLIQKKASVLLILAILWLVFYTFSSQVFSGYIAFLVLLFGLFFYVIWKTNAVAAYLMSLLCITSIIFAVFKINPTSPSPKNIKNLPQKTINGAPYEHHFNFISEINGEYLLVNYCEEELEKEWNAISDFDYHGKNEFGASMMPLICRYMTALGYTKDSAGVHQLSKQDIQNIEDGFTSPQEKAMPYLSRYYGLKYQLANNTNPNGHSLLQRFEFWKTSWYLIQQRPVFGVGTGGNQLAFDRAYVEINSPLDMEHRLRSHNMFLSYTISYGILGGFFFLFLCFRLLATSLQTEFVFGFLASLILIISCLTEDTLETQLGVTLFGLVIAFILNNFNRKAPVNN